MLTLCVHIIEHVMLSIAFCVSLVSLVSSAMGSNPPCSGDCTIFSNISFAYKDLISFEYPSPDATTIDTLPYDTVIEWVPEPGAHLSHSFEVYLGPNSLGSAPFDCSDAKLWVNGTSAGATSYTRGAQNDIDYCIFDVHNGVFSRDILENPVDVYFLFNGLTDVGAEIYIAKNRDTPVVASEDLIFYLYEFESTATATNGVETVITLTIANLTYESGDFDGIQACNDMETIMGTIQVGSCTLTQVTADNEAGVYTYELPKTDYEPCSETISYEDSNMVYATTIRLPIDVGSCHYFREEDSDQQIRIEIPFTVSANNTASASAVGYEVLDYAVERCDPLLYIVPQARALFTVNVTFAGESVELDGTPHLGDSNNPLTVVSKTCETHQSGSGNECVYVLRSTICRPLYLTEDRSCVFDRNEVNTIGNLVVTHTITTVPDVSDTVTFDTFNTALRFVRFPESDCTAPTNVDIVNVTDSYKSNVKIRNRPNPNWGVEPDFIRFYEDTIIELSLSADSPDMTTTELQIISVRVVLTNPDGNSHIAQYTWNKADKLVLHTMDWTRYYDDIHYCTMHIQENNTCPVFYDPGSERVNAYTSANLLSQMDDLCQVPADNEEKDYFTVLFTNWFKGIAIPTIDIDVYVTAIVNDCSGDYARRMLEDKRRVLFTDNKISGEIKTYTYVPPTSAPTVPTASPTQSEITIVEESLGAAAIAGIAIAVVACCSGFCCALCGTKRRRKKIREMVYHKVSNSEANEV